MRRSCVHLLYVGVVMHVCFACGMGQRLSLMSQLIGMSYRTQYILWMETYIALNPLFAREAASRRSTLDANQSSASLPSPPSSPLAIGLANASTFVKFAMVL